MPKLFDDDAASEENLTINKDYANNYDSWRQKEELNKLKTKYGENINLDAGSDEDPTSEDEEDISFTQEFERKFYKTLACLKNKDPKIYDENVKFFNENDCIDNSNSIKKVEKVPKINIRAYERNLILERGGRMSDSEDESAIDVLKEEKKPTYIEEQKRIKESFKEALKNDLNDDDDLLKVKSKSKEDKQKEEDDFKEWLKGYKNKIDEEEAKELKPLHDFWNDPNLDKNEKFLRDYVLNNKYRDEENTDDQDSEGQDHEDPKYELAAHDSDENLSADEKNIQKQEEFEHKYNFRFEEPDQEFIKRYPRTLENSLRKKDTKRSEKRAELKVRKNQEKATKKEELKRLKNLKRKEIEEKIEKLKEITGNDDMQFNMFNFDGDFDPNEHDKKMKELFNDDYYAGEEDVKPEFPDIDKELCIDTNWDNVNLSDKKKLIDDYIYKEPHCEDPDFNMDADYNEHKTLEDELIESTKKKKKKRRSKFTEMIAKEKPKFDPDIYSSFEEYYDQYYALDYEDMIGDLPCRFKYRKVVPNDYGLSVEEILAADDKELNKWCSLKRALQYRPEHLELNDVKVFKQKAKNQDLKKKILQSLYKLPEENSDEKNEIGNVESSTGDVQKKRKRKRTFKNHEIQESEILKDDIVKRMTQHKESITYIEKNEEPSSKKVKPNVHESKVEEKVKKKKNKKTFQNVAVSSNGQTGDSQNKQHDLMPQNMKGNTNKNSSKMEHKNSHRNSFKNKGGTQKEDNISSLSIERLKAYGLNPKKFKNKLKYMKKR